jgi:16S rRNA processing protein RimM
MMPDTADDPARRGLVLLGRIAGAHGIRGEVRINSFTAAPEDIAAYGELTDGRGRVFVIERLRPVKGTAVAAQLQGVRDRTAAEALHGTELFVERAKLPEPDEDEWYYEDLIGLEAVTGEGELAGRVLAVQNFGAGDLLEIRRAEGEPRESLFVPFTKAAVPVVDVKGGRVVIVPPQETDDEKNEAEDVD